ncbi:MAG: RpiB/LacA/LacB family sugar-phosphate isomerase, partial [Actinobacteria bacterium]|nr:RpiB/LacA/LacB family sugar-phosphate isomerase [Actinomycetota bacterium]
MSDERPVPTEAEVRSVVGAVVEGLTRYAAEPAPGALAPAADADAVPGPLAPGPATDAADVAIGADHGGYRLKERIAGELREHGFAVLDCGTDSTEP